MQSNEHFAIELFWHSQKIGNGLDWDVSWCIGVRKDNLSFLPYENGRVFLTSHDTHLDVARTFQSWQRQVSRATCRLLKLFPGTWDLKSLADWRNYSQNFQALSSRNGEKVSYWLPTPLEVVADYPLENKRITLATRTARGKKEDQVPLVWAVPSKTLYLVRGVYNLIPNYSQSYLIDWEDMVSQSFFPISDWEFISSGNRYLIPGERRPSARTVVGKDDVGDIRLYNIHFGNPLDSQQILSRLSGLEDIDSLFFAAEVLLGETVSSPHNFSFSKDRIKLDFEVRAHRIVSFTISQDGEDMGSKAL